MRKGDKILTEFGFGYVTDVLKNGFIAYKTVYGAGHIAKRSECKRVKKPRPWPKFDRIKERIYNLFDFFFSEAFELAVQKRIILILKYLFLAICAAWVAYLFFKITDL